MQIRVAKTAGFCFGVNRAVDLVYRLTADGKNVCTLGPIIHNPQIVEDLKKEGVIIIDSPSQAKEGSVIVIRSHGVPKSVYDEITATGNEYKDATCPYVAKIYRIVAGVTDPDALVIIAGDAAHPEVMGIAGHCASPFEVIKNADELEKLIKSRPEISKKPIITVAQTTYNKDEWKKCAEIIKKVCTNPTIFDTICGATMDRQMEAARLADQSDMMIVIGGRESSNTAKLYEICSKRCETLLVECAGELDVSRIEGKNNVGITAGASTPSYIIKEVQKNMSEIMKEIENEDINFAEEFEKTLKRVHRGARVKGLVVGVNAAEVQVDLGTKHAGFISLNELTDDPSKKPEDVVSVGDEIDVYVLKVNDQDGTVALSKKMIDAFAARDSIAKAYNDGEVLSGVVAEVVNGGVVVAAKGARVFVPASQSGVKKDGDLSSILKKEVSFKIIKMEERRGRQRVVGSIKAVANEERRAKAAEFWANAAVGNKYNGVVKSLTSFGAFVDLGGVDGMVHVSELSWKKIKNPAEVVSVGDEIEVFIKAIDEETKKISLGYKKAEDDPWVKFTAKMSAGDIVPATVVGLTAFGAFAEVSDGVDGLIHISQISNERINKPQDVLKVGDQVTVEISEIDEENRRVRLSMKAAAEKAEAPAEEEAAE